MPRPPDSPARGLSLLLAPRRRAAKGGEALAATARAFAAALAEKLAARYGLRAGFAPEPEAQADAQEEPGPGLCLLLRGRDGLAVATIGQSALYDIVDALFGGDGAARPYRDARKPSDLERALLEGLAPTLAETLATALGRDDIRFERVVAAQDRAPDAVMIGLKMRLIGRDSRLSLALPAAWLGIEAQEGASAPPALDALDLDLAVSLRDAPRPLADLVGLRVGDVLALGIGAEAPARVDAEGVALFEARLGQSAGRYTIRLERRLDGAAPFFEELQR